MIVEIVNIENFSCFNINHYEINEISNVLFYYFVSNNAILAIHE